MHASPPIVMISPYPELSQFAARVSREMNFPVTIVEEVLEEGVRVAREFEKKGAGCIISRGATGIMIKNNVSLPVILVQITTFDIFLAIYKAKKLGRKIAYFEHDKRKHNYDFGQLAELTGLTEEEFKIFLYDTRQSLEEQVVAAAVWRADVAVATGYCTLRMAGERGIPEGVMVSSTWEAVVEAFQHARDLVAIRRKDQKTAELMKTVIDHTENGIIVLDERKRITHFNAAAETLLGIKKEKAIGSALRELSNIHYELKDFLENAPGSTVMLNLRDHKVLAGSIPLVNAGEQFGTMVTLQGVSKIQNLEAKIRQELYARGLVSRYSFKDLVYKSARMKETVERARRFAASMSTVLISGESGTGKELLAHGIHRASPCRNGPFVAVNCAAIPENLLESELFGYSEGAFTGAIKGGKPGLFELAHGGTIFLDEISEMPLALQSRLLRVLQEKAVRRVGDDKMLPVEVRVIAATNRDLSRLVAENLFRRDLYYRINVLSIHVPPLRERKEDIFHLLEYFIRRSKPAPDFDFRLLESYRKSLEEYGWPGNIRELENFVEKLTILCRDAVDPAKTLQDLIDELYSFGDEYLDSEERERLRAGKISISLGTMEEMEKEILEKVQRHFPGENKTALARRLNLSRATLWKKLKEISPE